MPTTTVPPDEALDRLLRGNERFVAGQGTAYTGFRADLASGQAPFAVVVGCSDSRALAEIVFDVGLGDLFVVRVGGNIVAPSQVGSVEFAVSQFGTRLVMVMGHTRCGAITATLRALAGEQANSRNIASITDRIAPHIREVARCRARRAAPRAGVRHRQRSRVGEPPLARQPDARRSVAGRPSPHRRRGVCRRDRRCDRPRIALV